MTKKQLAKVLHDLQRIRWEVHDDKETLTEEQKTMLGHDINAAQLIVADAQRAAHD